MSGFRVYALSEDGGPTRYIGTTRRALSVRLSDHVEQAPSGRTAKDAWIRGVLARGGAIAIRELEHVDSVSTPGAMDAGEARWIARAMLDGCSLLNEHNMERGFALAGIADPSLGQGGAELARVFCERRVSFGEVAAAVGVSQSTVGTWVSGVSSPRGAVRERLAAWLGDSMSVDALRPADRSGPGKRPHGTTLWDRRDAVEEHRARRARAAFAGAGASR